MVRHFSIDPEKMAFSRRKYIEGQDIVAITLLNHIHALASQEENYTLPTAFDMPNSFCGGETVRRVLTDLEILPNPLVTIINKENVFRVLLSD